MNIKPPSITVQFAEGSKGRGVFAARNFVEGEVVEVSPVVLVPRRDLKSMPQQIRRLHFDWGALLDPTCKDGDQAFAEGYGGLYNHSDSANLRYSASPADEALVFVAVRAIEAGEELTINYSALGGGATADRNWWFDAHGVRQDVST